MGSPLGCTMANFCLGHLETLIFKDQISCHPKLYVCCVDDLIAVFDDVYECSSFLNTRNSQHGNINLQLKNPPAFCSFLMSISKLLIILVIHGFGGSQLIRVYSLTLQLCVPSNGNQVSGLYAPPC